MMGRLLRTGFATLTLAFFAGVGSLQAQPADPAAAALLAPTGHLRVGIYAGSPTSQVIDPETKQSHGVTYDLGRELAARLNVPVEATERRTPCSTGNLGADTLKALLTVQEEEDKSTP